MNIFPSSACSSSYTAFCFNTNGQAHNYNPVLYVVSWSNNTSTQPFVMNNLSISKLLNFLSRVHQASCYFPLSPVPDQFRAARPPLPRPSLITRVVVFQSAALAWIRTLVRASSISLCHPVPVLVVVFATIP